MFLYVCDLVCVWGAVAGHLLAACLQYGQVLASAVSRLVSAAAATPLLPPVLSSHLPPPTSLTDVATPPPPLNFLWAQPVLTWNICPGGACFCLGGCGVKEEGRGSLTTSVCLWICTPFVPLPPLCIHTPVWAEVESWFVLSWIKGC